MSKIKSEWIYLHRAIDKNGETLDLMLSKRRNKTIDLSRRIRPMLGFNSFAPAASVLDGIELVNIIRNGQFTLGLRLLRKFVQLAG